MYGDYKSVNDDTRFGLYMGPRLYLDTRGYFYSQASLAWHNFDLREDMDGTVSTYSANILGGFLYFGFKVPVKRIAFTLDLGLGRNILEYDREEKGHNLPLFPYFNSVNSLDINLCLGFNIGPRS